MDLATWERHDFDKVRVRRLAAGYVLGAVLLAGVLGAVAMTAAKAYGLSEDTIVEAALVTSPKEEPVVEVKEEPAKPQQQKPRPLAPLDEPTKDTNTQSENPLRRGMMAEAKVAAKKTTQEPIRVTEEVTPPKAISMQAPSYPAEAKAAGVEGLVVIQYVVTESGEVRDVQVVRGPPELVAVCVSAVKSWRFTPAMKEGLPVAVHRIARFPFRIKT